ncbi:MAG: hypothetical protein PHR09_03095, partial [Bacilli bacterium]|nr:hypothetical protein [Bacilli bacterium]
MKRVISFFNKSKHVKILTILYIIYIVLFALYMYFRPAEFNIIIDNDIDGPLTIIQTINLIISNSIIYLIFSLVVNFHITALYLGLFISYKIHQKQKLEIIDYKNNNIFRDILKEYSPGELGYIDDFQISENHIIATILDLELKNKIKIEESITVIDSDESNLLSNEKYILSNIKNNSYLNVNLKVFERKVLDDLERSELMDIKKPPNKTKKIITILCILLLYAIYILFIANREYEVSNPIVAFFLIP